MNIDREIVGNWAFALFGLAVLVTLTLLAWGVI